MSGFTYNTLMIRFSIMLSVYIIYRMHKVMRRMVKWNAMSNTLGDVIAIVFVSYGIAKRNNKGKCIVSLFKD